MSHAMSPLSPTVRGALLPMLEWSKRLLTQIAGIGALSLGSADQDLQPHRQAPKPPPPPNIMSAGVISTDITSRFTAATSSKPSCEARVRP